MANGLFSLRKGHPGELRGRFKEETRGLRAGKSCCWNSLPQQR